MKELIWIWNLTKRNSWWKLIFSNEAHGVFDLSETDTQTTQHNITKTHNAQQ